MNAASLAQVKMSTEALALCIAAAMVGAFGRALVDPAFKRSSNEAIQESR